MLEISKHDKVKKFTFWDAWIHITVNLYKISASVGFSNPLENLQKAEEETDAERKKKSSKFSSAT